MRRARYSDGHARTCDLAPCTCPSCGEDLEITCPNRCATAHEGASGRTFVAARDTTPPRVPRPGTAARGSRPLVVATLQAYPGSTAREVADRLTFDINRVSVMLAKLEAEGAVCGVLPPLMKRGKKYWLAAPANGEAL